MKKIGSSARVSARKVALIIATVFVVLSLISVFSINLSDRASNEAALYKANYSIDKNGVYTISPKKGYDGFSSLTINVDVAGGGEIIEVDELPTKNINTNSLYLCNGEYYKWVESNVFLLNDELNFDSLTPGVEYVAEFTMGSGGTAGGNYTGFIYSERAEGVYGFGYRFYAYGSTQSSYIYYTDSLWGQPAGWMTDDRIINFIKMPTDEDFLSWLDINAKRQSGFKKYTLNPSVYTLASVDELPSNVVDGSVAIVKMPVTRWLLNDELILPNEDSPLILRFNVSTTNNLRVNCTYIHSLSPADGLTILSYAQENYSTTAYQVSDSGKTWVYGGYKELSVYYADENALAWLNANGTVIESGITNINVIYIHENGEWVYKCEMQ